MIPRYPSNTKCTFWSHVSHYTKRDAWGIAYTKEKKKKKKNLGRQLVQPLKNEEQHRALKSTIPIIRTYRSDHDNHVRSVFQI